METRVEYLSSKMKQFLRKGERVLVCFPEEEQDPLGDMICEAVRRCDASVVRWGPDLRWKTLLRLAFSCKAGTIIGPPLVILGLTKLARATGTPLYIRNVVTAGYPCMDWMIEGIRGGLDCQSWGFLDCEDGADVAGFSCRAGWGVHLRREEFDALILDENGEAVEDGMVGDLCLVRRSQPDRRIFTMDRARLERGVCACGDDRPRLMDMAVGSRADRELVLLGNEINQWTSVLDCRLEKGSAGLEIEIVVFPGEKLPKLPSCAKLIVRPWNPATDAPLRIRPEWKNACSDTETH